MPLPPDELRDLLGLDVGAWDATNRSFSLRPMTLTMSEASVWRDWRLDVGSGQHRVSIGSAIHTPFTPEDVSMDLAGEAPEELI